MLLERLDLRNRIITSREQVIYGGILFLMLTALAFGSVQITLAYNYLRSHSQYVRDRDARWETWIKENNELNHEIEESILSNQKIIIDHINREEAMWRK